MLKSVHSPLHLRTQIQPAREYNQYLNAKQAHHFVLQIPPKPPPHADEAMEAWHCLLKATCTTENEPRASRDVYFALGNLHYLWGELLERGKKAELGAEGAARAVVAEVKALRRRALQKRAEATRASKKKPPGLRVEDDGTKSSSGQESSSLTTSDDGDAVKVRHPEAWEWYLKAAEEG